MFTVFNKSAVWSWVHISKHSLFRLKITVGCLTSTYPSIHVGNSLKITVGCLTSTYSSIHFSLDEDTLKITVGCLTSAYPSVHVETLRITVGCPLCTYPSINVETLKITRELHARSIITSKFSVACAAAVVSDDCCHLLFRHCWKV